MARNNPYTRDWIEITHPKTGGVYEIPQSSLPHYKSLGWRRVTKKEQTEATEAATTAKPTKRRGTTKKKG